MKKTIKDISLFFFGILLIVVFSPKIVFAIPSENSEYKSYDYVIDKYDINIIVNENNTLDITENITAYFNEEKHGIYRKIPLRNKIERLDGTTSSNRTVITNVNVDHEYTTSKISGNYEIKIGSEYKVLVGSQNYKISYNYNLGKDPSPNYDELYLNLIGPEWDTVIGEVTFSITMPKSFDSTKLGFSHGHKGSTESMNVSYSVKGNTITGKYNGVLNPEEALTVRLELEEGYFVGAGIPVSPMDYLMFILPILFLIISIYLWYKFGRDEQVVETVEFYPPQGFNSLEVGFLYKGRADNQDVISLLVYLANKGYIKISEFEKKSLFSKTKDFKLTKLKDYDGNNENERLFLDDLFKTNSERYSIFDSSTQKYKNVIEVTKEDLYDRFYLTINRILYNINNKQNKNKIFEKSASSKTIFIVLMIIITFCLITIPPISAYSDLATLPFALLFPGIGFTVMFSMLFGGASSIRINGKAKSSSIATKLFGLIWGGMFGGMPWAFLVLPTLLQDSVYLTGYIIGIISILGMVICLNYLPKRTQYGNQMLGKISGFKNFLETAEKERLEAMVLQDPSYFYNILPYTYVLGVSDKWIKKFESISLQAPSWYDGSSDFNMVSFGHFMSTTMSSASSAMSSSPSSSSSSGGGSSGGGSGGGGGGSW